VNAAADDSAQGGKKIAERPLSILTNILIIFCTPMIPAWHEAN
jgi:hypothetical protein